MPGPSHSHLFSSKMTHEQMSRLEKPLPQAPQLGRLVEGGVWFSVSRLYFNSPLSGEWVSVHEKQ